MAQTTTLSSAGTSTPIILNPVSKSTTVMLSVSNNSTGYVQVDFTLDDPSTTPPPTMVWGLLSSAAAMASSSVFAGGTLVWTVLTPIGGVRIASSGVNTAVHTLKALQSVSA